METTQQSNFLQNKIKQIGSAICYNLSDAVLKLPTSVVKNMQVDDYGYIWFYVQKPNESLQLFDPEFPVRLDFYRKGCECFVQAEGTAWVVNDPEEISSVGTFAEEVLSSQRKDLVLVKVKLQKAEYSENRSSAGTSWWQNAVNTLYAWFGNNQHSSTYYPAS